MTQGAAGRPLATIVTRTMGRDCLAEAGASVAAQTYRPLEWIVVDAAGKGVEAAPAGDVPTRVVGCGKRMLRSVAGNFAFGFCRGRWLMNLDDDDLLRPEHVARLGAALEANPDCWVAYSDVETWEKPGLAAGHYAFEYSHFLLTRRNLFPPHGGMFDARLVRELGVRYDEAIDYYDDWDLWLQMARHTRFVHVPGVTAIYRLYLSQSGILKVDTGDAEPEAYRQYDLVRARYAEDRARLLLDYNALRLRAMAASDAADAGAAVQLWHEVVTMEPYDVEAITRFAEACMRIGDLAVAQRVLEVGMQLQPREGTIAWNLALVLDARGQFDAAVNVRRFALELDPSLAT